MIQRYAQFWFLNKGFGNSFFTTFCVRFFKKNIPHFDYGLIVWRSLLACNLRQSRLKAVSDILIKFLFFLPNDSMDSNESPKYLNIDVSVISQWAYQWKMLFNPDPKKPVHEVIFSRKKMKKPILVSFTTILKFLVQILKSTWV